MSGKQDKRMRKLARKQIREEYRERARELAELHSRILKPRPRWFPEWLWIKLLSVFVYIKK